MAADAQDAATSCSAAVVMRVSALIARADLAVEATVRSLSPSQSNNIFPVGQSFTLSVWVANQGDAAADSTQVHYYRSSDATLGPTTPS